MTTLSAVCVCVWGGSSEEKRDEAHERANFILATSLRILVQFDLRECRK